MTYTQLLLFSGGIFHLVIALFHIFFWRIFHWKEDLASLTRLNRAIVQILNMCLTFFSLFWRTSHSHTPRN